MGENESIKKGFYKQLSLTSEQVGKMNTEHLPGSDLENVSTSNRFL